MADDDAKVPWYWSSFADFVLLIAVIALWGALVVTSIRAVILACRVLQKGYSDAWLGAVAGSVWLAFLALTALIALQRIRAMPRAHRATVS